MMYRMSDSASSSLTPIADQVIQYPVLNHTILRQVNVILFTTGLFYFFFINSSTSLLSSLALSIGTPWEAPL